MLKCSCRGFLEGSSDSRNFSDPINNEPLMTPHIPAAPALFAFESRLRSHICRPNQGDVIFRNFSSEKIKRLSEKQPKYCGIVILKIKNKQKKVDVFFSLSLSKAWK